MNELHVNKKIKYSSDTSTYTVQMKKRRKPWWLLLLLLLPLLLLPLLLLVKFDHSLTVKCYDCQTYAPIKGADVRLTYDFHYVIDSTGLFPKYTFVENGVTDEDGRVKFENVKCGVFCFLFYPRQRREIFAMAPGYSSVDTTVAHHRHRCVKLPMCRDSYDYPPDTPLLPDKPVFKPCDELQHDGSNQPESFVFDMGQQSGSFLFEYATGSAIPDLIIIYDGESRNDRVIFRYRGVTGGGWDRRKSKTVHFTNYKILIDIIPEDDPNTYWEIKANCP